MSAAQTSMYDFEDALDVDIGEGDQVLDAGQKAIIEKQSVTGRKKPRSRFQKKSLMNRSANYMLDMLQEEDDDELDQLKSFEHFGTHTGSLADFNSFDKLEGPGFATAREQHANSGFLKIQPCMQPTLTDD